MLSLFWSLLNFFLFLVVSVVLCLPFVFGKLVNVIMMLTFVWDQMLCINILIIINAAVLAFVRYHVLFCCLIVSQLLVVPQSGSMVLSFLNERRMLFVIIFHPSLLFYFHVFKDLVDQLFRLVLKSLLLVTDVVQGGIVLFFFLKQFFSLRSILVNFLLLFDYIDCDRAEVVANERHAPLLLALHENRAATAETVSIMLTGHAVASVHSSENVAGQLSRGYHTTYALVTVSGESGLSHCAKGLPCHLHFSLRVQHLVDWVEGAGTVISYEHRYAPAVALGEDLRAAATSTLAIVLADQLIAQIFMTRLVARSIQMTSIFQLVLAVIIASLEKHLELD